jgi:hypothetical protein
VGELVEAARGKREFGVDVERRGGEAAEGDRELSGESQLKAELGLAATALGEEFGYGVAGYAAGEAAVEDLAAKGAFRRGDRTAEEIFRAWSHCLEC